jgi:hypothetical protein
MTVTGETGMSTKIRSVSYVWTLVAFVFLVTASTSQAAQDDRIVGDFTKGNLAGWKEKVFNKSTRYEFVQNGKDTVLKAQSRASASGLFREINIDLAKTPCLTWSWKVDGILDGLNETTKKGDDYPARLYVMFSGGMFFWQTRALNYVWSNAQPKESNWPNAYTQKSINIAVQSGSDKAGKWISESRNIRDDYRRLIGEDITWADGVALMTDTDDSGKAATAYYGEIRFTSSC